MRINNIEISEFNAKVQRKMIDHINTIPNIEWRKESIFPLELGESREEKRVSMELLFKGNTRDEVHNNISKFMAQVNKCEIKFRNLSHNFMCYYKSHNIIESGIDEWLYLNIEFSAYEYGELRTVTLNKTTNREIENQGNLDTPVILRITPLSDMIDLSIKGFSQEPIIIKKLESNKTVVLDGESMTVTVGESNKFMDTELWEFPRLLGGVNKIELSSYNCIVIVEYKERFI